MEDGKLRLKKEKRRNAAKKGEVSCPGWCHVHTHRRLSNENWGERQETIAAKQWYQTVPSNDLFGNTKTSWVFFPSLPSHSPFSFYIVHVTDFAIHLARDSFLLVSLQKVHWTWWADNSYSSRKLYEQKAS